MEAHGPAAFPLPHSEEKFIIDHYFGYTRTANGCSEYAVEHPPWRISPAQALKLDLDPVSLYGKQFAEVLAARPSSAFIAEGSAIIVRKASRIPLERNGSETSGTAPAFGTNAQPHSNEALPKLAASLGKK
jgi:hypothetical protein